MDDKHEPLSLLGILMFSILVVLCILFCFPLVMAGLLGLFCQSAENCENTARKKELLTVDLSDWNNKTPPSNLSYNGDSYFSKDNNFKE